METLACYRLDDVLLGQLSEISGTDDYVPAGQVPAQWLETRTIGAAEIVGDFADICRSEWVAWLACRSEFRGVDTSALQSPKRLLTQAISGLVYQDESTLSGIRYPSRFGHDIENWAIYDRAAAVGTEELITLTNPDLREALQLLRLEIG